MSEITSPALRPQHNGWTLARQRRFLDCLEALGSVAAAARSAGMSRQSAYWLRRQPGGQAFAAAWDAAVADTSRLIEDLAMDRLVEGEEEVIERQGEVVAVRRRPCDVRLLLFQLNRLESRRHARQALQQAVLLRALDRQDAPAAGDKNRPDPSKVSKVREEIAELARLNR